MRLSKEQKRRKLEAQRHIDETLADTKAELSNILLSCERFVYEPKRHIDIGGKPATLYRADSETLNALKALQVRHDDAVGIYVGSRFDKRVCKLFNPDAAIGSYSVNMEIKFKHISDPEKVLANLEGELNSYIRKLKSAHKKKLKGVKPGSAEAKSEAEKLRAEIERAERSYERLLDEFDALEVHIHAKQRSSYYHTLHAIVNGRQRKRHLSVELPNVVWYEEELHPNNRLDRWMRSATNAFGDVYYAEKKVSG